MATQSFESLKSGDKVILRHCGGWKSWDSVETVTRVTPKMVILGSDKFRKDSGYGVGDNNNLILQYSVQKEAEIKLDRVAGHLSSFVKNFDTSRVSSEDIAAMAKILNKYEREEDRKQGVAKALEDREALKKIIG